MFASVSEPKLLLAMVIDDCGAVAESTLTLV